MKTLSNYLFEGDTQSITIEDVAKAINRYVEQWEKYHIEDNDWPDDLEPVKKPKDGIVIIDDWHGGKRKELDFTLKGGEGHGRIIHQLTNAKEPKYVRAGGFSIFIDDTLSPYGGYQFYNISDQGFNDAIKHIKMLVKKGKDRIKKQMTK